MCAAVEEAAKKESTLLKGHNDNVPVSVTGTTYVLYKRRWLMLTTLCFLNISSSMMGLTYSPIPQYTAQYYSITVDEVNWFSEDFFVVSVVMGFVTIVILDVFGLRASIYIGAGTNLLGSAIRWLSTADAILCSHDYQRSGYMVAMIGQTITAFAQPFLLYAPTKLAAVWFGPKERAICTTVATIGSPVGLAVVQVATPFIVTKTEDLPTLTWVYTIPAAVGFVLALLTFWQNKPPTPPSPSTESNPEPFLKGLKQVMINPSFWILTIVWAGGVGVFNELLTLFPQFVCPYGYTNVTAGIWGALMIVCGLIGAALTSVFLGWTRLYKEVGVFALGMCVLCSIWFLEVSRFEGQPVNIAFSLCMLGLFSLPLIPVCMEPVWHNNVRSSGRGSKEGVYPAKRS